MRMHNVDVKSSVWISWIMWISWIIIHEILENAKVTFADVDSSTCPFVLGLILSRTFLVAVFGLLYSPL